MVGTGTIVLGDLAFKPNPMGIYQIGRKYISEIPIPGANAGNIQVLGGKALRFKVKFVLTSSDSDLPSDVSISDGIETLRGMYNAGNEIEWSASEDRSGRTWYYRGVVIERYNIREDAKSPYIVHCDLDLVVTSLGGGI